IAVVLFLLLQLNSRRHFDELARQIAGLGGEERLRTLEQNVQRGLQGVNEVVERVDRHRGESIASLETVVRESQRSLDALNRSTDRLNTTLSNSQARGQWGERMAEDILRSAGMVLDKNYRRNRKIEG